MKHYYAYIDEAGDEGFGKLRDLDSRGGQSTWLILGALIVNEVNNPKLPAWRDELRSKFVDKKKLDLHWANLNHDQRVVVCNRLAELPLGVSLALSHKVTIPGTPFENTFKRPQYLYNYLVRFLLERLISACCEKAKPDTARLHLTFSRRGGTNYEVMRQYLRYLAGGYDYVKAPRKTDWSVLDIDGIEVENHSKRAGLQLADCITSPFFTALERNRYGNIEPAYALRLVPRLVSVGGKTADAGLKIVPNMRAARCDAEQLDFLQKCWGGK